MDNKIIIVAIISFVFIALLIAYIAGDFKEPYQIIKTDGKYIPLVRFNKQTGKTDYFNHASGGWVTISDTNRVTVSVRDKEKAVKQTEDLSFLPDKPVLVKDNE